MTKRVPITVWLTPTELATIDRIAAQLERPRSETARRLFNDALSYGAAYHQRTDLEREADQQAATARANMAAEASSDGPIPYPGDEIAERLPGGGWREREDNLTHGTLPVRKIARTDGPYCQAYLPAQPGETNWQCTEPAHSDGWHIAVAGRTVVAVWPVTPEETP